LDIKPYIPYADAFPDSHAGWLQQPDPREVWNVTFDATAEQALEWIHRESGFDLRTRITQALVLGPKPHAYRRIKHTPDGSILAVKEWRARFRLDQRARHILVETISSGYGPRDLAEGKSPVHDLHRAFVAR